MSEADPSSARKIPVPTDEVHRGARQVSPSETPDEMRRVTEFFRKYEEAGREERERMVHELFDRISHIQHRT